MEVKILNQYTQTWEVDGHVQKDVFRTHKTLEQLKNDLDFDGYIIDGQWSDDGQVTVVLADVQNAKGSAAIAKEFNEKKKRNYDYYTLDELKKYDLVFVKGFGIVDEYNFDEFENKFKVVAQNL